MIPDETYIDKVDRSSSVETEERFDETQDLFSKVEHEGDPTELGEHNTPNGPYCILTRWMTFPTFLTPDNFSDIPDFPGLSQLF
jgi:hypothetical protein